MMIILILMKLKIFLLKKIKLYFKFFIGSNTTIDEFNDIRLETTVSE